MDKKKRELDAREAALAALTRVEEDGAFVNLALADVLASRPMDSRDKRLATEITYGVISYKLTLDWLITQVAGRPTETLDSLIRQVLRIGFYQLFYLTRVPAPAAVHATVELVKKGKMRGLAPFVNGVMRGALRKKDSLPWPKRETDEAAYLSLHYSHPLWLVKRWLMRYGSQATEKLLAANNSPAPVAVRVNTLRTTPPALLEAFKEVGLVAEPSLVAPEGILLKQAGRLTGLALYRLGYFQVQGESAMLTSLIVDPQPKERVLDGCSAPGGKTSHLAQLMNNTGEITALDIYPHRLELVAANCRRLGVDTVQTVCLDARDVRLDVMGEYDRILLDVPCSGFGVIRRKPDLKWRREAGDIAELAHTQKVMLLACAELLKPGGVLVYSTCTNEPEETSHVVATLLEERDDFAVADLRPYLPRKWHDSIGDLGVHLLPHIHNVDGFYISRLTRNK